MMIYKNKHFTPLYFWEDEVEIDYFRQPLLQFHNLSEPGGYPPPDDARCGLARKCL